MTSQPKKQVIRISIMPNISTSEGNQAIKLGRLTECDARNIFIQKSCRNWGKETSFKISFF